MWYVCVHVCMYCVWYVSMCTQSMQVEGAEDINEAQGIPVLITCLVLYYSIVRRLIHKTIFMNVLCTNFQNNSSLMW